MLPTRALRKGDEDYALAFAIPADSEELVHIGGTSLLNTRELEGVGCWNIRYS